MQIRNAPSDRRLELLDCRMTVLGLDLDAIKNGKVFDDLKRQCLDCVFPEACGGGPEAQFQKCSLGDILSDCTNA